ncbi:MAG: InlB B-repeat-containing protein [Clostridia bacterium]|nr:InlB B-repeat-containing protein [Clostridia bacterium]
MYNTKSNKLSILLSILAVIVVIGLCGGAYIAFFRKPVATNTAQVDTATNEQGEVLNDGKVHSMPGNMLFAARSFSENLGEGDEPEPIEAVISAEVAPAKAKDKAVDWTLEFVNANSEWATGKTLSDYVTVTPKDDGALVATVSCYQAFGEQIRLTVTSRDNPTATASCLIDYKQQLTGMEIALSQEGKTPTVNNNTKRGTVYADFENENPLVVTYNYLKSDVYTVPVQDGELFTPVLTVSYKEAFANALNAIKANSAKIPSIEKTETGFSLDLLSKSFIDGLTPAETNSIISAINTNKSNAVIFTFTNTKGAVIATYTFTVNTTAIQEQYKVQSVAVGTTELIFSEYAETYNITYMRAGSTNGKTLFEIGSEYGLSKQDGGFYPETYTSGETFVISNLKSRFDCSGPGGDYHSGSGAGCATYEFHGWYLDSEKTIPFNGTIPAGTTGDITLYADISMLWTHAY